MMIAVPLILLAGFRGKIGDTQTNRVMYGNIETSLSAISEGLAKGGKGKGFGILTIHLKTQEFLDRGIIPDRKVVVLPGAGINLNEYPPVPYPDHSNIRFLYLGRIMKEKGMDELFSAMRRLYAELGGRVHLDLVGFFDDDYEAEIQALVADGIADFHGFQTDPRPYYANADCVILPSYHESLSNVLLEAAATGRPVITTDIHGCKETVDPGVSGLLCHVQDADSLYRQMRTMASLSPVQRRDMGLSARKKVEREFEKQMVVDKTLKALGL